MKTETCNCGLLSCEKVNTKDKDKDNKFILQPLPYAENALAPHISEKTIQYHYGKHLAAYIDNTNKLKAVLNLKTSLYMRLSANLREDFSIMQLRYLITIFTLKHYIRPEMKRCLLKYKI